MNYKIYNTSKKTWNGMFAEISKAKKSIFLEMYIFTEDIHTIYDFVGKLQEKSSQGVRVIMVLDSFGSSQFKKKTIAEMRASGIEIIFFSSWLRRIHRKILIVDEKVAFIGGVNISQKFATWNDLQLKLRGKIIRPIITSFAYTYQMAGGRNPQILVLRKKTSLSKFKFWFLEHWPIFGIYSLKAHYTQKIFAAQKNIHIITPYFTPPRWFVALLDMAIQRGVQVEIIIPKKTNHPFIDRISHRYMHDLSLLGAKFYLSKKMNHAKVLLIDDVEGLIGSQNIDLLSFYINAESGVFFRQKNIVAELQKIILQWKKDSDIYDTTRYKMRLFDYIISPILKLIYRLI